MFGTILQRSIMLELLRVFFITLVSLTGLFLLGGLVAEASNRGLAPAQILTLMPLMIPSTLPYTIPATTLFAVCLVYGRLAADNEILAIKAAGINLSKVVLPGLLLGLAISAGTMGLYYRIIPYTHHLLRTVVLKDVQEVLYAQIKRDRGISHPHLDFALYVKRVQGHKLIETTIKQRDKNGRLKLVIQATEAELDVDVARGKVYIKMRNADIGGEGAANGHFLEHTHELDLASLAKHRPPRPSDMSWKQLHEYRAEMVKAIGATDEQTAAAQEGRAKEHRPEDIPKHLTDLGYKRHYYESEVRQVDAEFQMRPALSCGCLCFVLIGCPVGIWFSRGDYLSAFISCFLPVVFLYYPLVFCGANLAKDGRLPASVGVWAADAAVALVGLGLYARLTRN